MHFQTKGGLTIKENDEIVDSLGDLMHTNPVDMLLQHLYLLLVYPENLGEGPLNNKRLWILRMEAAILAKEKVNVIGSGKSEQTRIDEGGCVNGESKVPEEH